jgi:hypothetical protein
MNLPSLTNQEMLSPAAAADAGRLLILVPLKSATGFSF